MITKYKEFQNERYYIDEDEDEDVIKSPMYNIGDIVRLNIKKILDFNKSKGYTPDKNVALFPAHPVGKITKYRNDLDYPYRIKFYDGRKFDAEDDEILRKANSDEIEEFLFKKDTFKYNL